ncbi:MAG: hypothetical protein IJP24_06520 [Firmicutes bacterium]|nr:hypothetical protein [Bacillota bacterium]MBQ9973165.1 hypothetical protein [Bacillota bacterium]
MGDDRCDRRDFGRDIDCCERECIRECKDRCYRDCCCDNNGSGLSIIWILVILYLLFCNNDNNGRGGLFGGLF